MTLLVRNTFCALLAASISGCGGGGVVLTPPPAPSPSAPAYVFTGLLTAATQVFAEYGPIGTIPIATFPAYSVDAIAIDRSGIIYVANAFSVSELAPKTHRLLRTLRGFYNIVDLKVDAENNLYVVDQGFNAFDETPPVDLPSTLREYAPGSVTPSRSITTKHPQSGDFISAAIDRAGTLYAGSENGNVAVIPAGAVHPQKTIPATLFASSLAIDTLGDLYVLSLGTTSTAATSIRIYAPGGSAPMRIIRTGLSSNNSPRALFLSSTNELFVANGTFYSTSNTTTVNEYGAESDLLVRRFRTVL